jgi:acyl-coenzyme A synthetase/AMP-(fatty) acid ligase
LDMSSRENQQARTFLVNINGEKFYKKDLEVSQKIRSDSISGWHISTSESRLNAARAAFQCVYLEKSTLFIQGNVPKFQVLEMVEQLNAVYPKTRGLSAFLTSGSTGRPKIIVHPIENFFESASKILQRYLLVINKTWHHFFPINYMAGILNSLIVPWESGGSVLLDDAFNFSTPIKIMNQRSALSSNIAWLSPKMIASLSIFAKKMNIL